MVDLTEAVQKPHRQCACCSAVVEDESPLREYFWHRLEPNDLRAKAIDLCSACWEEIRDNPAPKGALAPTVYERGLEDGEDHCAVCGATFDGSAVGGDDSEGWHTHKQCFEEGKNVGALDENLECAQKLSERIGCEMDYFHSVLERVPPATRLPGELRVARVNACELVYSNPEIRTVETIVGLRAVFFIPMQADTARFTREHMGMVGLERVTAQVSIDDDGHTCWSEDGVTCGLCRREIQGSPEAAGG